MEVRKHVVTSRWLHHSYQKEHFEVHGYDSFIIIRKLKMVKEELKKWNKELFGDVKIKNCNLQGTISSFDLKDESIGLTLDEINQRKSTQTDIYLRLF